MDTLKNKKYEKFEYLSRYSSIPYYYDTLRDREVFGIGSKMLKNIPFVSHEIKTGDSLDKLALEYYNNPTFWWAIAYFNDITDPFEPLEDTFKVIKIPSISSIAFGDIN